MWSRGEYEISTERSRLDLEAIHRYLSEDAYWSPGVSKEVVESSIAQSLNFGLYRGAEQAGFARVVTDGATIAWLADVFVLEEHRGRGLGVWLVETVLAHPALQGIRRIALTTRDAHGLYEKFGLTRTEFGRFMDITIPDVYRQR